MDLNNNARRLSWGMDSGEVPAMRGAREITEGELSWHYRRTPSPERRWGPLVITSSWDPVEYELRSGENIVARLLWPGGAGSGAASARTAEHEWQFRKSGWFGDVEISSEDGAVYALVRGVIKVRRNDGYMTIASGLKLRRTSLLSSSREWRDGANNVLVTTRASLRAEPRGIVRISARAHAVPELDLLLVVAWYKVWPDALSSAVP